MIEFNKLSNNAPYILFKEKYDDAINANQKNIEAISISSFDKEKDEVSSRFVNLKFINDDQFIFFTNYNSPKSLAFKSHDQIAGLFYWPSINVQIRIKAVIKKTTLKFNQEYFTKRSTKKNALAISSRQSGYISSYKKVVENYDEVLKKNDLLKCPDYWGGFSFIPHYFEFWEGHESRLNKRVVYLKNVEKWEKFIIQP